MILASIETDEELKFLKSKFEWHIFGDVSLAFIFSKLSMHYFIGYIRNF